MKYKYKEYEFEVETFVDVPRRNMDELHRLFYIKQILPVPDPPMEFYFSCEEGLVSITYFANLEGGTIDGYPPEFDLVDDIETPVGKAFGAGQCDFKVQDN